MGTSDGNFEFLLNFVAPDKDGEVSAAHGNSHKVVNTNCLDPNTLVQREAPFESLVAASNARFSYTAFIFASSPDTDSANLDLVCNIAACLDADCANIINDCGARRRRRAAAPKAQTYKLSTSGRFSDL